jgi:hypothetical protein
MHALTTQDSKPGRSFPKIPPVLLRRLSPGVKTPSGRECDRLQRYRRRRRRRRRRIAGTPVSGKVRGVGGV